MPVESADPRVYFCILYCFPHESSRIPQSQFADEYTVLIDTTELTFQRFWQLKGLRARVWSFVMVIRL